MNDIYLDLPKGAEWMIKGAYTPSFRIKHQTAPFGRCWYIYMNWIRFSFCLFISILFYVGVSYPSITSVVNCTDVYPLFPNGTKWSTREIMREFFPSKNSHGKSPSNGDFNVLGKTSPSSAKVRLCNPARSWRRSGEGRERISHGQERVMLGG